MREYCEVHLCSIRPDGENSVRTCSANAVEALWGMVSDKHPALRAVLYPLGGVRWRCGCFLAFPSVSLVYCVVFFQPSSINFPLRTKDAWCYIDRIFDKPFAYPLRHVRGGRG